MIRSSKFGLTALVSAMASCLVALATTASAAPQPHPRIWLNAPTITRLQSARTANTAEWQTLRNWCDSHLGQNLPEGYQYLDWYSYVLNYGLAYRITGDNAYGNEGVKYLVAMLRDRDAIGDGLGGTNAIAIDVGYVSRSLGVGVAMGRDWLDGAPNLTPALINECTTRMGEWYTWVHTDPQCYGLDQPSNNYYAGHFGMTYSAFIAFEGDPGYQTAWETKAEEMWVDVRATLNQEFQGGDSPEGWNYGHRAIRHLLGYPWALETGTDRANHWNEIDVTSSVVRAQLHMLHPSRDYMADDGRWSGDVKGDPRPTTCLMMSVLSDTDATAKGLAVWQASHLVGAAAPDPWESMLYTDPSIAPIAPTAANMGGLTWKGWGQATTRAADWTNLAATFVNVIAWTPSQEEANFGEVKLSSRGELLLVDGQTWQLEGEFANIPLISGTHTYAPYSEYWHDAAGMTVESEDGVYSYFKIDNMENAYDGVNDNDPSAAYVRRDVVFLPPDHMVVFDNIRTTSLANTVAEQWHLMGQPTISGDTAVLTKPNAKLFVQTVNPAVGLTKVDNDSGREGTWRLTAAVTTPSVVNHVITLFEATAPAQGSLTPHEQLTASGFKGLHIQDASDEVVLMLATAEDAANTTCQFTYLPVAGSARVVVIGMAPNTTYTVTTTPAGGGQYTVSVAAGTGVTSKANGSLAFTVTPGISAVDDWMVF